MRMLSFIGVLSTVCWLATTASAQNYRDTTGDAINPGKAINESPANADIQLGVEQGVTQGTHRVPVGMPENQGNHWRYRFQNSQWWYYQPNHQWVVWNGKSWVEPSAMAGNRTAGNQQQPHQSGYRGTQGMTGQQPATQPTPANSQNMPPQSPTTMPKPGNPMPQNKQPAPAIPNQPST